MTTNATGSARSCDCCGYEIEEDQPAVRVQSVTMRDPARNNRGFSWEGGLIEMYHRACYDGANASPGVQFRYAPFTTADSETHAISTEGLVEAQESICRNLSRNTRTQVFDQCETEAELRREITCGNCREMLGFD
jgi:hypothetical protein